MAQSITITRSYFFLERYTPFKTEKPRPVKIILFLKCGCDRFFFFLKQRVGSEYRDVSHNKAKDTQVIV